LTLGDSSHAALTVDALALMRTRADADFVHDVRGRMVSSNEPRADARRPAPSVFLGSTMLGHVVRFGESMPEDLVSRIATVVDREPSIDDLGAARPLAVQIRNLLAEAGRPVAERGGPVYHFPTGTAASAEVVHLSSHNRHLVRETFPWLFEEMEDWQPCFAMIRGGAAVSVCFSARVGAAVAEAGVETLVPFRGRGFASAAVARWAMATRKKGRVPIYSTDWDNHASQAVARRLNLQMFGVDTTWVYLNGSVVSVRSSATGR
jgi:hypothetical protein